MAKKTKYTILILCLSITCAYAQDLTFKVDFTDSKYPTSKQHILRVAAKSENSGWNGNFLKLSDLDNDGIYTGTVIRAPKGNLLFQIREGEPNSNSWGTPIKPEGCLNSEFDGANYKINIDGDITLSFKAGRCLTPLPVADVTFKVDLKGTKYPEKDKEIRIGGNEAGLGWKGNILVLQDDDKDGIYEGTAKALKQGKLLFRVYQGNSGGNWDGDWISSTKGKKCKKNYIEGENHKINIEAGKNKTITFKLNDCLTDNSVN